MTYGDYVDAQYYNSNLYQVIIFSFFPIAFLKYINIYIYFLFFHFLKIKRMFICFSFRQSTVFSYKGKRVCFFANADSQKDISLTFEGRNYTIPPWSCSIYLDDCVTQVYNTAHVCIHIYIYN